MSIVLSPQKIGSRIAELRTRKGLSQSDLSKIIKISRPSLSQIESGKRSIEIFELKNLSMALDFSLDDFMSEDFSAHHQLEYQNDNDDRNTIKERIAEPILNVSKYKNVLLYILERCAGKPNVGDTVLKRLLYFVDFNYYEIYEEHITGERYIKQSLGPFPQSFNSIIQILIEEMKLQVLKSQYYEFPQIRYIPLAKSDLTELKASEKEVIDNVILQMSDWSVKSISEYALRDMPCLATKEANEIEYELAFYREIPFSVRNYESENE